jgi:DNA mismatch repair protein MutS2
VAIKGKDVEMLVGDLKSNVKINRLEKVSRKEIKKQFKEIAPSLKGVDLTEKMANFSYKLDVRGMRGEEALGALQDFMDDAILLGHQDLQIIHGKGDGILRKLLRDQLRKYKEVDSLADEHADRGGAGVTIIKMK